MQYDKPALTHEAQLMLMESRGLAVGDRNLALHRLRHHNYYRLSAYRFPLSQDGDAHTFREGCSFEELWGLYEFDWKLRALLSQALKCVEISTRAHFAYTLGHAHGAQAYENRQVFKNPTRLARALEKLDEELARSQEIFVTHFRDVYNMQRPPVWAACEVMSFGLLSHFYENLKFDRDRKTIASGLNLPADLLESFLKHGSYVRNLCAHHCRLWNRELTLTLKIPQRHPQILRESMQIPDTRRLYNTLTMLVYLVQQIDPDSTWPSDLLQFLTTHPFPVTQHMGFPDDWQERPIWTPISHLPTPIS
jgi:abortive infection bacteriophage resistance protein